MKTLYFYILIMLPFGMFAQSYIPILDSLNVWYYSSNFYPILTQQNTGINSVLTNPEGWMTYDHYTDGDSVINTLTYKKLMKANPYPNPGALQGFVREDTATGKIYYMNAGSSGEYLIYDFSLQIGDSTYIQINDGSMFQSGYYILDSITNKVFNNVSRRVYYLNKTNCGTLEWVEGIGNRGDFVYSESWSMGFYGGPFVNYCSSEFPYNNGQFLTCFYKNENRQYFDTCALFVATTTGGPCFGFTDSCNYGYWCGGLNEFSSVDKIKVFPNPSSTKTSLEIEAKQSTHMCIRIIDALGRIVWENKYLEFTQGKNIIALPSDKLKTGIYQVVLNDSKRSYYTTLCIE